MPVEQYVPERFDERHFKVLIEVGPCAACSSPTTPNLHHRRGPFPKEYLATFEAQLSRAGIRLANAHNDEGKPVCAACAKSKSGMNRCELCHTEKTTEQTQWSGGGGQYFLCKACYKSTPAAVWDSKVLELCSGDGWPGYGAF